MNCTVSGCTGRLRITHTYTVLSDKFQRAVCEKCGTPHCLRTKAEPVTQRGEGARALAAKAQQSA